MFMKKESGKLSQRKRKTGFAAARQQPTLLLRNFDGRCSKPFALRNLRNFAVQCHDRRNSSGRPNFLCQNFNFFSGSEHTVCGEFTTTDVNCKAFKFVIPAAHEGARELTETVST